MFRNCPKLISGVAVRQQKSLFCVRGTTQVL